MTIQANNSDTSMATKVVRPPIVAVLGHVDHGKTSLLDAIRKSHVAAREAGGITQSIGASTVTTKDGKQITFIDTPGHAAFSQMRSRGAKVADIIILVVAADDGVKPQTREALEHILASEAKFLVVFTKIDLQSASVEQAQTQLEELGVYFEGRGGDTPYVGVSSRTGQGIEELLELIALMSEINEIKADLGAAPEAVVIETSKDKRGQLVSVVVRNGTLKAGQEVTTENVSCKVRGLFDANNKAVKEIGAGYAGMILGFDKLPEVGALITGGTGESSVKESGFSGTKVNIVPAGSKGIFLKTQTAGSMEALLASLPAKIVPVASTVGDVTESDILFAKSAGVPVIVFDSRIPTQVVRLAETEGVRIETFDIIYELIKYLEDMLTEGQKEVIGKAEILDIFPYENKKVAGSKITSGIIRKSDSLTLMRGEREIGKVKVVSMRKMKNIITEAKPGEELGILFEPQFAFEKGDVLVSHAK